MRLLAAFVFVLLFALPGLADEEPLDVVTLYNGRTVEGRVEEATDDRIVLVRHSKDGGVSRFVLRPEDIKKIDYGKGGERVRPASSSDQVRDAWFLLRSDGKIVGTRHLEMWSLSGSASAGYRIEENLVYFAQGRHVPSVHLRLVEETDRRFVLVKGLYREVGDASKVEGAPGRYVRAVAGSVTDGVFKGGVTSGGESEQREVVMAIGTRGRLGLREHLLRRERNVGIDEVTLFDVAQAAQVEVRAGFVSVGERRHELHWEEGGTRLISYFETDTKPHEEALSDAVVAIPTSRESAEAAADNAVERARDPKQGVVMLPEGGIRFTLPDASWTWRARTAQPTHTGWRALGRAEASVFTADVRIELHPEGARIAPGVTSARAWLVERLRGVASDLQVFEEVEPLGRVDDGWRLGLVGTLRGDTRVRTIAIVIDRGDARLILLVACPEASWKAGRPAVERFIESIELL